MSDRLGPILARKRREIARRGAHLSLFDPRSYGPPPPRSERALRSLRRGAGGPLRVIAEVKHRSPSAGVIRPRAVGGAVEIARGYQEGGASAISVLADWAGFGGSVLDLRRVARAVEVPVLFKEFVLDELQLDLARAAGASLVLLLVRALSERSLHELVEGCLARGLEPVVEAADSSEVHRALASGARVIGVNARDLSSFEVDPAAARDAIEEIPSDRVGVYMSGVSTRDDLRRVAETRADAVLIGSGLMVQPEPGRALARWLESSQ